MEECEVCKGAMKRTNEATAIAAAKQCVLIGFNAPVRRA